MLLARKHVSWHCKIASISQLQILLLIQPLQNKAGNPLAVYSCGDDMRAAAENRVRSTRLVERDVVGDHAAQRVDDGRVRHRRGRVGVAEHLGARACNGASAYIACTAVTQSYDGGSS